MSRILKWLGAVVGVVSLALAGFVAYVASRPRPRYPVQQTAFTVEATPERAAR